MEETTTPSISTRSVGIKYGLVMAVISIAYFVILNTAGVDMTQGIGRWGSLVFYAGIIFLAQKNFKDQGDSFMSYGQGIGITFWISLISSVIGSIFTYFYVKFIDTGYIQQILDKQREQMAADANLSEEQIDNAISITMKFMTPEMILVFGIIGGIIMILIVGLVVTIFTQRKNLEP